MKKHWIWILLLVVIGNSSLLFSQQYHIGDVIVNEDGSQGVVFYINPDGTGGWMVAMDDDSPGCKWGGTGSISGVPTFNSYVNNTAAFLAELDGKENTRKIREYQGNNPNYAAGMVEYPNWYLPSIGQLRILISNMGLIQSALTSNNGSILQNSFYWSSTQCNSSNAWGIMFDSGYGAGAYFNFKEKNKNAAVRAIRDFVMTESSEVTYYWQPTGQTTPDITVSPAQSTTYSVTVSTGDGCETTESVTVLVIDLPEVGITTSTGLDVVCEGDEITLHAGVLDRAALGDILCEDGTVVKVEDWPVEGKKAKGIVFYVDRNGRHGWAVGLRDLGETPWCDSDFVVPGLANYLDAREAIYDFNGASNTQAIRLAGDAARFPAVYQLSPSMIEAGWYLPAMGQLRYLYANLVAVNAALQRVHGTLFSESTSWFYWSSTQYDAASKWELGSWGEVQKQAGATATAKVRAVCSF